MPKNDKSARTGFEGMRSPVSRRGACGDGVIPSLGSGQDT